MTTTAMPPESRLRDEDLVPGKAWVHPDTSLEYEDFHAFLCGKDPLPHWRNAKIKRIRSGEDHYFEGQPVEDRIRAVVACFDRLGVSQFGVDYAAYAPRAAATL